MHRKASAQARRGFRSRELEACVVRTVERTAPPFWICALLSTASGGTPSHRDIVPPRRGLRRQVHQAPFRRAMQPCRERADAARSWVPLEPTRRAARAAAAGSAPCVHDARIPIPPSAVRGREARDGAGPRRFEYRATTAAGGTPSHRDTTPLAAVLGAEYNGARAAGGCGRLGLAREWGVKQGPAAVRDAPRAQLQWAARRACMMRGFPVRWTARDGARRGWRMSFSGAMWPARAMGAAWDGRVDGVGGVASGEALRVGECRQGRTVGKRI
ncbi:hypothetical protein BJ912DRAFT_951359 [Pholiota molesta]|nr:hypothetical protein BJ912DRAFT_951359 [Pholiota molesta]